MLSLIEAFAQLSHPQGSYRRNSVLVLEVGLISKTEFKGGGGKSYFKAAHIMALIISRHSIQMFLQVRHGIFLDPRIVGSMATLRREKWTSGIL